MIKNKAILVWAVIGLWASPLHSHAMMMSPPLPPQRILGGPEEASKYPSHYNNNEPLQVAGGITFFGIQYMDKLSKHIFHC